jgi:hypothetical protein
MDENETVQLEAHFNVLMTPPVMLTFQWSARMAMQGDSSYGSVKVIRSNLEMINSIDIGQIEDFDISGKFLYSLISGDSNFILKTINIEESTNPEIISEYNFTVEGYNRQNLGLSKFEICALDKYVYVAINHYDTTDINGLHIFDASDPSHPIWVGHYNILASDVDVVGNHAYVLAEEKYSSQDKLLILDLSIPSDPKEITEYPIYAERIKVRNNYAYSMSASRLVVLDISSPDSIEEVSTKTFDSYYGTGRHGLVLSDSFAYVLTPKTELLIFDTSIPTDPVIVGNYVAEDYSAGFDISISGDSVYIAYTKGLIGVDIGDPNLPMQFGHYSGSSISYGRCIEVDNKYIYLGAKSGLFIFSLPQIDTDVSNNFMLDAPSDFMLCPAYPNPFNSVTTIKYHVLKKSDIELTLFNLRGQRVRQLLTNQFKEPGQYQIQWDGNDDIGNPVADGVYHCRMKVRDHQKIIRLLLLR